MNLQFIYNYEWMHEIWIFSRKYYSKVKIILLTIEFLVLNILHIYRLIKV